MEIRAYLEQKKQIVDHHLDRLLPSADAYPPVLHEAMRYSLFAGGKRLRPVLALATGEALGGDFSQLIHFACAVECIHTYSLIHDDLPSMDNDDYRRGKLTCHRKFGEGVAILAGNGLMTLGFQLLAEIPGQRDTETVRIEVIRRMCRAIGSQGGVIAGQVVDLQTQGQPFTESELHYIHSAKTGALIEASITCAALISGASPETSESLRNFGLKAGLAFQVVDDILDVVETSDRLGKTAGKDSAGGKATYTALHGLETSRKIAEKLLEDAIQSIRFLGTRAEPLIELAHFISIRRF